MAGLESRDLPLPSTPSQLLVHVPPVPAVVSAILFSILLVLLVSQSLQDRDYFN